MSKVIVITGAGTGLGRALARRLASDGDMVVLLGRTLSKLESVVSELGSEQAMALQCDIALPDSVRSAFAAISRRFPRIDVLINNAVIYQPFLISEATDQQILQSLTTNLAGPIFCARAAIAMMGRGGHILNVTSESVGMNFPYLVMYQASKAGLERFSEGLYHELDQDGIRVTTVRAGSMMDADKTWDVDPAILARFAQAAMGVGLNLMERPVSQFASVTNMFRALIDLPPDLHAAVVHLHARKPD
jgi:meso-butanediol dehydrogenase / (S,S)-butanediol dehydrogenase / diacetyl reductase